jgi:hypothetical protein
VAGGHPGAVPRFRMFLFFSNRLGCMGSLLVSALFTLVLLVLLGIVNLD